MVRWEAFFPFVGKTEFQPEKGHRRRGPDETRCPACILYWVFGSFRGNGEGRGALSKRHAGPDPPAGIKRLKTAFLIPSGGKPILLPSLHLSFYPFTFVSLFDRKGTFLLIIK